jgi:hypothetical protein
MVFDPDALMEQFPHFRRRQPRGDIRRVAE